MEKSLKDLISRLPIPGLKESANRHTIAEIISRELHLPVKASQISFKDSVISVSVPPVMKSALRIKEQRIFSSLTEEGIVVKTIR